MIIHQRRIDELKERISNVSYALAKQIPSMYEINSPYGEFSIEYSQVLDSVKDMLEKYYGRQLAKMEKELAGLKAEA